MNATANREGYVPASIDQPAQRPAGGPHAAAPLRLTRRGRIVFGSLATVLVAAVMAVVAAIGAPQAEASDVVGNPHAFDYVVVAPGSSLWDVATSLDSTVDPRDLVAEMVQLNQLDGSNIVAGQPIAVPLRYSGEDGLVTAEELGL